MRRNLYKKQSCPRWDEISTLEASDERRQELLKETDREEWAAKVEESIWGMSTRGLNIDAAAVVAALCSDNVACVLPATKLANRSRGSPTDFASLSGAMLLFKCSSIVRQPFTDSVSSFISLPFPLLSPALIPTSLLDCIRRVAASKILTCESFEVTQIIIRPLSSDEMVCSADIDRKSVV